MNDVTWTTRRHACPCSECGNIIAAGNPVALFDEIDRRCGLFSPQVHIARIYCEPCGKLLEDSLTTTEAA
jgi:hypothetical protein